MKTKLLFIPFILVLILAIACDEESITEAVLGANSITLTGDISDSFDAQTLAILTVEDSDSAFAVFMSKSADIENYENNLFFGKASSSLPAVGTYNVGGNDNDPNAFYSEYTVNDSTFYLMTSGTVEITTSSATKIEGKFDMTGQLFDNTPTTGNELNVVGKFSTTPVEL